MSTTTDYLQRLYAIVDGLNRRFPDGNDPFQMMTRLCEEAGELATEVNHFEKCGVKLQKRGEPDRKALAAEIRDVLGAALCLARYYGVEEELREAIDLRYQKLASDGYIHEPLP